MMAVLKEKQLKNSGINVPSNFKTKSLILSSLSSNPLVSYILLENESKKLLSKSNLVLTDTIPGKAPEPAKELDWIIVEGKIVDKEKKALSKITVSVQGIEGKSVSDTDGIYKIRVPKSEPFTIYFDDSSSDSKNIRKKEYKNPPKGSFGTYVFVVD